VTAVTGTLDLPAAALPANLDALLDARPDIRALAAERDEALAEVRLGESQKRARFGGLAQYEREGSDQKVLAGLTVTFPVFNSGEELRLPAAARARRLEVEIDATRNALRARIEGASAAAAQRREAVELLLRDALPQLEENEQLARRSYEAGQISLSEWLTLRRELLDTRHDYLARAAEAILARLELDAMMGVLR
jgi:cobalt-zinc-cadmium efflux system outer membrane protein